MKKMGGNKGFTLVELIIVIAILAIIMLIAIPNFSGIQQRMKVRADKATAAQIGKAVRVWYTDYTSDPTLAANVDKIVEDDTTNTKAILKDTAVDYSNIANIESYASKYTPSSLLTKKGVAAGTQVYQVKLSDTTSAGKIVVIISGSAADADDEVESEDLTGTTVNYDGTKIGIAYVEP